jgi:uncharacterized membrane-anchored protein YitT (DUF2179 family)
MEGALRDLRHTRAEDALALLSGTALVALAVSLLQQGHLLSGGTAGLAELTPRWIGYASLEPVYAALMGGMLSINHRRGRYLAT